MKSKTEYLTFNTSTRRTFINITALVAKIVTESDIKEGLCLVNAMHISASVFINDDESGLHGILIDGLRSLCPILLKATCTIAQARITRMLI